MKHQTYDFTTTYEKEEVDEMLKSLFHKKLKYSLLKDSILILLLSIFVALGYYYSDFVILLFRMFLVYVIHPFVMDLKKLAKGNCLVNNPQYVHDLECDMDQRIDVETVNFTSLSRLRFERIVLVEKKWLIIRGTDVRSTWEICNHSNSMQSLNQLYQKDEHLKLGLACELESSFKIKNVIRYSRLLDYVVNSGKAGNNWFMGWKHCGINQTYSFRKLYKTPVYLPVYTQTTDKPWIIVIKEYGDLISLPKSNSHVTLVTVVQGSVRLYWSTVICDDAVPKDEGGDKSVILEKGDVFTGLNHPEASMDLVVKQRYHHKHHDNQAPSDNLAVLVVLFPEIKYNEFD